MRECLFFFGFDNFLLTNNIPNIFGNEMFHILLFLDATEKKKKLCCGVRHQQDYRLNNDDFIFVIEGVG